MIAQAAELQIPVVVGEFVTQLTEQERDALALAVMDVIRCDVVHLDEFEELFRSWAMTVAVRNHTGFNDQAKEYQRLVDTGELYEDMDSADSLIADLRSDYA